MGNSESLILQTPSTVNSNCSFLDDPLFVPTRTLISLNSTSSPINSISDFQSSKPQSTTIDNSENVFMEKKIIKYDQGKSNLHVRNKSQSISDLMFNSAGETINPNSSKNFNNENPIISFKVLNSKDDRLINGQAAHHITQNNGQRTHLLDNNSNIGDLAISETMEKIIEPNFTKKNSKYYSVAYEGMAIDKQHSNKTNKTGLQIHKSKLFWWQNRGKNSDSGNPNNKKQEKLEHKLYGKRKLLGGITSAKSHCDLSCITEGSSSNCIGSSYLSSTQYDSTLSDANLASKINFDNTLSWITDTTAKNENMQSDKPDLWKKSSFRNQEPTPTENSTYSVNNTSLGESKSNTFITAEEDSNGMTLTQSFVYNEGPENKNRDNKKIIFNTEAELNDDHPTKHYIKTEIVYPTPSNNNPKNSNTPNLKEVGKGGDTNKSRDSQWNLFKKLMSIQHQQHNYYHHQNDSRNLMSSPQLNVSKDLSSLSKSEMFANTNSAKSGDVVICSVSHHQSAFSKYFPLIMTKSSKTPIIINSLDKTRQNINDHATKKPAHHKNSPVVKYGKLNDKCIIDKTKSASTHNINNMDVTNPISQPICKYEKHQQKQYNLHNDFNNLPIKPLENPYKNKSYGALEAKTSMLNKNNPYIHGMMYYDLQMQKSFALAEASNKHQGTSSSSDYPISNSSSAEEKRENSEPICNKFGGKNGIDDNIQEISKPNKRFGAWFDAKLNGKPKDMERIEGGFRVMALHNEDTGYSSHNSSDDTHNNPYKNISNNYIGCNFDANTENKTQQRAFNSPNKSSYAKDAIETNNAPIAVHNCHIHAYHALTTFDPFLSHAEASSMLPSKSYSPQKNLPYNMKNNCQFSKSCDDLNGTSEKRAQKPYIENGNWILKQEKDFGNLKASCIDKFMLSELLAKENIDQMIAKTKINTTKQLDAGSIKSINSSISSITSNFISNQFKYLYDSDIYEELDIDMDKKHNNAANKFAKRKTKKTLLSSSNAAIPHDFKQQTHSFLDAQNNIYERLDVKIRNYHIMPKSHDINHNNKRFSICSKNEIPYNSSWQIPVRNDKSRPMSYSELKAQHNAGVVFPDMDANFEKDIIQRNWRTAQQNQITAHNDPPSIPTKYCHRDSLPPPIPPKRRDGYLPSRSNELRPNFNNQHRLNMYTRKQISLMRNNKSMNDLSTTNPCNAIRMQEKQPLQENDDGNIINFGRKYSFPSSRMPAPINKSPYNNTNHFVVKHLDRSVPFNYPPQMPQPYNRFDGQYLSPSSAMPFYNQFHAYRSQTNPNKDEFVDLINKEYYQPYTQTQEFTNANHRPFYYYPVGTSNEPLRYNSHWRDHPYYKPVENTHCYISKYYPPNYVPGAKILNQDLIHSRESKITFPHPKQKINYLPIRDKENYNNRFSRIDKMDSMTHANKFYEPPYLQYKQPTVPIMLQNGHSKPHPMSSSYIKYYPSSKKMPADPLIQTPPYFHNNGQQLTTKTNAKQYHSQWNLLSPNMQKSNNPDSIKYRGDSVPENNYLKTRDQAETRQANLNNNKIESRIMNGNNREGGFQGQQNKIKKFQSQENLKILTSNAVAINLTKEDYNNHLGGNFWKRMSWLEKSMINGKDMNNNIKNRPLPKEPRSHATKYLKSKA